jgi:hypothetical protein
VNRLSPRCLAKQYAPIPAAPVTKIDRLKSTPKADLRSPANPTMLPLLKIFSTRRQMPFDEMLDRGECRRCARNVWAYASASPRRLKNSPWRRTVAWPHTAAAL